MTILKNIEILPFRSPGDMPNPTVPIPNCV